MSFQSFFVWKLSFAQQASHDTQVSKLVVNVFFRIRIVVSILCRNYATFNRFLDKTQKHQLLETRTTKHKSTPEWPSAPCARVSRQNVSYQNVVPLSSLTRVTSRFVYPERFSPNLSSSSFAIRN